MSRYHKQSIATIKLFWVFALLAIWWGFSPVLGDTTGAPNYRIRPGDTLDMAIAGEPTYSGAFVVSENGAIFIGAGVAQEIKVAALTLEEAKALLTKTLADYLINPVISLRVSKFRVSVSGEVARPGSYEMMMGETVQDAIGKAGGVKTDAGFAAVHLKRPGAELLSLKEQTVTLYPGDEVIVDKGQPQEAYKVSGAVKTAGFFPLSATQPVHLSEALAAAGRWSDDANPRRAVLIRKDGTQQTVDLTALDGHPGAAQDLVLENGDELFVPRNVIQIDIQGSVVAPGQYMLPEDATCLDAFRVAKGARDTANLKECMLIRMKPVPASTKIDMDKVWKKGDLKANVPIQDGDMLVVPERGSKRNWMDYLSPALLILRGGLF
jgi:polysaccharide biosynthesis/export protein